MKVQDADCTFSTVPALFRLLAELDGDFVIVNGLNGEAFQKTTAARERKGSKIRFHYDANSQRLLITVPTFEHELVHGLLSRCIYQDVHRLGLTGLGLLPASSTTFTGGGGSAGEADASFLPPARAEDQNGWPTLVVETGIAQSMECLRSKMRWWFAASDHGVKIVVLVKVELAAQTLVVEKHIQDLLQTRYGATNTRHTSAPAPQLRQTITVAPQQGSNPVVYSVRGGPLVLEFPLVFLRPPDATRGERDLVVGTAQLAELAAWVWARA